MLIFSGGKVRAIFGRCWEPARRISGLIKAR
jgi:hypothetical protein